MPLIAASCSSQQKQENVLNVGLLLGAGGLGDRSFNDSAYDGLLRAQQTYNIRFEIADFSTDAQSNMDALRLWARNGFDLIIGISFDNLNSIQTVAGEFPGIKFGAIDFELKADNVASIVYREQEADFLMGVLCAMLTKTGSVGVVGGTDIPAIRRIMSGFSQGARFQNPNINISEEIAGSFADPQLGYDLAIKLYNQGVDVIHNAASRTGLGIIEAAKESGKLTTGASGDQRYLAPGNVVGNRPKRVDTAVMLLVGEVLNGSFESGIRSLGLKEDGLALGPFDSDIVTPDILAHLADLENRIISGEILVQG